MSLNSQNSPSHVRVDLGAVAADTLFKVLKLERPMTLKQLQVLDPTGVAAHATNTVKVQVKVGSTVYAEWDTTLTTGDGALPANAWVVSPDKDIRLPAGELDVNVDVSASGALNAGAQCVLELYG